MGVLTEITAQNGVLAMGQHRFKHQLQPFWRVRRDFQRLLTGEHGFFAGNREIEVWEVLVIFGSPLKKKSPAKF